MKRRTPEERYQENVRKQQMKLEEFAACEIERSDDLLYWYKLRQQDMPDDEYRACTFFLNKEYLRNPGSLSLLYQTNTKCNSELPNVTKENAFGILSFKYKMYAKVLKTGGFF